MGRPKGSHNPKYESETDFFLALSQNSNYIPESTVRDVYFGLVNLMRGRFKNGQNLKLPGIGKFRRMEIRGQRQFNFKVGAVVSVLTARQQVVFNMCDSLKKFVGLEIGRD